MFDLEFFVRSSRSAADARLSLLRCGPTGTADELRSSVSLCKSHAPSDGRSWPNAHGDRAGFSYTRFARTQDRST
jgi:hypothetical protein